MLTIIVILIFLNVLAFVVKASITGAAKADASPSASPTAAPEHCGDARRAIRYYVRVANGWRARMNMPAISRVEKPRGCSRVRYLAKYWRGRARSARRWWHHEYAWWEWMSDKFQRIGACETGYGKRPGNFRWNSGTYQGFAGFYFGTWDAYKPKGAPSEAYLATPRQQYETALNVYRAVGYGAWGCGGA